MYLTLANVDHCWFEQSKQAKKPKPRFHAIKMKSAVIAFSLVAAVAAQDLSALAQCGVSVEHF